MDQNSHIVPAASSLTAVWSNFQFCKAAAATEMTPQQLTETCLGVPFLVVPWLSQNGWMSRRSERLEQNGGGNNNNAEMANYLHV